MLILLDASTYTEFNLTINIRLIPTFKFIFNSTIQFSYVLL